MPPKHTLTLSLVLTTLVTLQAEVIPNPLFSDNAVLQQGKEIPVWGTARNGEKVTVEIDHQTVSTTATSGRWLVRLKSLKAGGPYTMKISGDNTVVLNNLLVGEVWICSGQSNMEFNLRRSENAEAEIAQSDNPQLRQFSVPATATPEPMPTVKGSWIAASPANSGKFTAVGYYFAKKIHSSVHVPVGLIHTSWGGSPVEAWTSAQAFASTPEFQGVGAKKWSEFNSYTEKKRQFVEGMNSWVKANGREDKAAADPALFAGLDVAAEGWNPVKLPGPVSGPALPETGAVWLRKEITVDQPNSASSVLRLPIDGFESVYWNGKLLNQTRFQDFDGAGSVRSYGPFIIPAGGVRAGKNVLALRLYEPVGPAQITGAIQAEGLNLSGDWQAKSEYTFPVLTAQQRTSAPALPPLAPRSRDVASALFNGMINPLLPYAIRGAIWYQGEANALRAYQYRTAFPLMITDWRKHWQQGDFPFYFCQLANFGPKATRPTESNWAELREAQSAALKLPNTGQAVLIDIGETGDIHPLNKKDAGERLARIALARDYQQSQCYSGPAFTTQTIENGKVVLHFQAGTDDLVAQPLPETYRVRMAGKQTAPLVRNRPGSQLEGFAVCGADRKWVWADARIEGKTVVVWSDTVTTPLFVRYGWDYSPTCNLYNSAGLPASPFRTDDFPLTTLKEKY